RPGGPRRWVTTLDRFSCNGWCPPQRGPPIEPHVAEEVGTKPRSEGSVDFIPTGRYGGDTMKESQTAETTRQLILRTAFEEFYRYGFQAGSLNRIIDQTGLTKGALFHHFASKQELGYAVVDEIIWPRFQATWVGPLAQSADPIRDLQRLLRRIADE